MDEFYKEPKSTNGSLLDELYRKQKPQPEPGPTNETDKTDRLPSLVDDVFAGEGPKASRRPPVWLIVTAVVALFALVTFIIDRAGNDRASGAAGRTDGEAPAVLAKAEPPAEIASPSDAAQEPITGEPHTPGLPEAVGSPDRAAQPPQAHPPAAPPESKPKPAAKEESPERSPAGQTSSPVRPVQSKGADSGPGDDKPKLIRDGDQEEATAQKEQKAFELLRAKSDVARQLVEGGNDQLEFVEWQVSEQSGGQSLVHLIATPRRNKGEAIHLIWMVDPAKQTVKPLSQAARDLEAGRIRM